MPANPFYNALLAIAYIVGIVSLISWSPLIAGEKESVFIPMAMLSLFVLSAAVMAYLFFYHPVTLLLDGHREKAVRFFLHTVGTFALGVVAIFLVAFFVSDL